MNPKKFLKTKTKKNSLPQVLRNAIGKEANMDNEKAPMFNEYFYSTFNFETNLPYPNRIEHRDPNWQTLS